MIYVLDIDGTLIDSSRRHGALLKSILDNRNIKYEQGLENYYLEYKRNGNTTMQYLTEVLQLGIAESKEIAREWVAHIEDWEWISMDVLYDDTIPFLTAIGENNRIIYLSNRCNKKNLFRELSMLQIQHYAAYTYISNPKNGCEDKSQFLQKIKKEALDEILVVGDSEIDKETAERNNVNVVLLNRGFRSKYYWDKVGAISYYSLREILSEQVL